MEPPLRLFLRLLGDDPELKSLLRKEFFRSKLLFGVEVVAGDAAAAVPEVADGPAAAGDGSPSSWTCFSALAASFLDSLKEPPVMKSKFSNTIIRNSSCRNSKIMKDTPYLWKTNYAETFWKSSAIDSVPN